MASVLPDAVGIDVVHAQSLGHGGVGDLAAQHVQAPRQVGILLESIQPVIGQAWVDLYHAAA